MSYFDAEPSIITAGQSSSLRWSVHNATVVEISPEIGQVKGSDRHLISPVQTSTYALRASNAAGTVEASVTVTVSRPPTAMQESEGGESSVNVVNGQLRDVHFDYNEGDVRLEDRPILESDANLLHSLFQLDPNARVTIEGHCDERGSDEYNMALGDRRASAVKDALVRLGVSAEKLDIISYGKERPLCTIATEECYARNRRAHFGASHRARVRTAIAPQ